MQRVIFLVDMNAFFISCEMTRNPSLHGKPAAVAGDPKNRTGIILAANYEARSYGVKTAMVLYKATQLCPKILLVPPDHNFYEQKSSEVMNLLSNFTPNVEQNSIDEAWLDMTGTERLFGTPTEAAKTIMTDIKDKLGLWCSIGIAGNKFLSKMASEMKKPLGITELWEQDIPTKLWPLPIKEMYGVGAKTAEKLRYLGIETIGDLAHFNIDFLARKMGKAVVELHQYAMGIDNAPVTAHDSNGMKSIGRSVTLPEDISDIDTAKLILMELAEDIGMSARMHGKKGHTVQITLKYNDFSVITRQASIPSTCVTMDIYHTGLKLLEQNWNLLRPVRLIGISLGGFEADCIPEQLSLFDTSPVTNNAKNEKLDRILDTIKQKHGKEKISRAALVKKKRNDIK